MKYVMIPAPMYQEAMKELGDAVKALTWGGRGEISAEHLEVRDMVKRAVAKARQQLDLETE